MTPREIAIGTRRSPLAQAQTDRVVSLLPPGIARKVLIASEGDLDATRPIHELERPGAFTSALTDAILDGRVDAAVHSLKDLPLLAPEKAPIVAVLPRDDAADLLIHREETVDARRPLGLRANARVGTSAPRRQTQVLATDPDIIPVDVRGNVGTRLDLLGRGVIDALLMASAAFERMPLPLPPGCTSRRLDPALHPPGPGQGAIAVQARAGSVAADLLGKLDHAPTRAAVELERAVLAAMGGGCGLPLGAYAERTEEGWALHATLATGDWQGAARVRVQRASAFADSAPRALASVRDALLAAPVAKDRAAAARIVALTLAPEAVEAYEDALASKGWTPAPWPLLSEEETEGDLPPGAADGGWVALTSPRAAPFAARFVRSLGGRAPRVAALGPATARALRRAGLPVHVVSPKGSGADLADAIARFPAPPQAVLLPQAEDALPDLAEGLARRGFRPLPWPCYRVRAAQPAPALSPAAEAVVITSPSNVDALAAHPARPDLPLIAFGPTTEAAMRQRGFRVHATLAHPSPSALLEVLP